MDEYWLRIQDAAGVREELFTPTPTYRREVEAMEAELRGERSVLPDADGGIYMIEMAHGSARIDRDAAHGDYPGLRVPLPERTAT